MSDRLSKTLTIPLFSATKTRPSGEKRTAVGSVSPEKTISSWKPAGSVAAPAGSVELDTATDDANVVIATNAAKRLARSAERRPGLPVRFINSPKSRSAFANYHVRDDCVKK